MQGQHAGAKMNIRVSILLAGLVLLNGCSKYPGEARASVKALVGSYDAPLRHGTERITLNADMTFLQVDTSPQGVITTRGTWQRSNEFLGPTEVLLMGCYESEACELPPPQALTCLPSPPVHGDMSLAVHKEQGRLRLYENEAAGCYYERTQ
jgi:hypothetical protein